MINIPLEVLSLHDNGFHLLVEVTVFDEKFKAVVDTGASKTVFDKGIVESYLDGEHLSISAHVSTGLGTTNMESYTWMLTELKIGAFELKDFEVAVLDLSTINHAYSSLELEPVIGVIGGDILSAYKALINYGNATLTLKTPRGRRKRTDR